MPSAVVPRKLCSRSDQRFVDQAVGLIEAGRLHSRAVRRREDDELDVSRISSDVGLKPTLEQQAEPMQGRVERTLRRALGEAARSRVGRTKILSAPSSTACEIGASLTTPPSTRRRSAISTGGKTPGIEAEATIVATAGPSESSTSRPSIRSKATRSSGMTASASSWNSTCRRTQLAQPAIRGEMVASPAEAPDECAHANREDVLALEVAPHPPELAGRRDGLWSRRDKGGAERPHRGCHQQVREDAALIQRVQHSHLHGAEAPAAR